MRSLLALLALLAVPAAAIVVGIDMGNEFMKVSTGRCCHVYKLLACWRVRLDLEVCPKSYEILR